MTCSSLTERLIRARVAFEREFGRIPIRVRVSTTHAREIMHIAEGDDEGILSAPDGWLGQWYGMDFYEDPSVEGEPVLSADA